MPIPVLLPHPFRSVLQIFTYRIGLSSSGFRRLIGWAVLVPMGSNQIDSLRITIDLLLRCCPCRRVSTSYLLLFTIRCHRIDFALLRRIAGNLELEFWPEGKHQLAPIFRYLPSVSLSFIGPVSTLLSNFEQFHGKKHPIFYVSTVPSRTVDHLHPPANTELSET